MEKASKGVAWVCIFSTLLMGCHSSGVIFHAENEKDHTYQMRISSQPIYYLVTRNGTRYDFDINNPPAVTRDGIVGEVRVPIEGGGTMKKVTIPISDVEFVSVKPPNVSVKQTGLTVLWVVLGMVAVVGVVVWLHEETSHFHLHLSR